VDPPPRGVDAGAVIGGRAGVGAARVRAGRPVGTAASPPEPAQFSTGICGKRGWRPFGSVTGPAALGPLHPSLVLSSRRPTCSPPPWLPWRRRGSEPVALQLVRRLREDLHLVLVRRREGRQTVGVEGGRVPEQRAEAGPAPGLAGERRDGRLELWEADAAAGVAVLVPLDRRRRPLGDRHAWGFGRAGPGCRSAWRLGRAARNPASPRQGLRTLTACCWTGAGAPPLRRRRSRRWR
jgi:hypothetical protein